MMKTIDEYVRNYIARFAKDINNEFFKDCAFVLKKPILRDNNVGTKDVVINVVPTMNV
mgnify:CR=1 FL=1